jgi:hypothetical protein
MSDLVPRLRADLVDAHARYRRRSRPARAARRLDPRTWQPSAAAGVMALAVLLVAVVVAVGALSPPWPAGGRPRVAAIVAVGGIPQDAAAGAGSLWVADFNGAVVRVDPGQARVAARIPVKGNPTSIAFGAGAVWVMVTDADGRSSHLDRIDPASSRIVASIPIAGAGSAVTATSSGVWVIHVHTPPQGIERIDPATNRVVQHLSFLPGAAIDASGDSVWATANTAALTQIDAGTGRVEHRWPGIAPVTEGSDVGDNGTLADPQGAWTIDAPDSLLLRLQTGRVVRRLSLPRAGLGVIGHTGDVLWTAAGHDLDAHYALTRIDPDAGRITATLDLGNHKPLALIGVGDDLCVVSGDGTALVIR